MRLSDARLVPVLLALGFAPACRTTAPTEFNDARRAAIADSVRRAFGDFTAALGRGDVSQAIQFYSDDPGFRWVEDGTMRYTSRRDIARDWNSCGATPACRSASMSPPSTSWPPMWPS